MGYISIQINKAKGSADTGASDHIERKTTPKNADPTRTHLNRELVQFPDGVADRTGAISHRIRTAGIRRKITPDQVRAIRIVLSGTHEDMIKMQDEGRLGEWCDDNLQWLHRTFGKENTVSAVLHMDEHTPHIHATVVPIVTGERRKARKKQAEGKRTYRKKANAMRLCADDLLTRERLVAYHDSYAAAMAKYGLQRGVRGSDARHTTTAQYYRDMKRQTGELEANVRQLQTEQKQAEQQLDEVRKEIRSEKLEAAKTEAKAALMAKVGSLMGSGKLKELEADNRTLQGEVAARDESIELLQQQIERQREEHQWQLMELQAKYRRKMSYKEAEHQKEVSFLKSIIQKAKKWFPLFQELVYMEKFCLKVGFNERQTATLISGKPLFYEGELYSEEHNRQLMELQAQHRREMADKDAEHQKEVSFLKSIIQKAKKWFPLFQELVYMEKFCLKVGFTERQTATLISGKPLFYEGELYSEEHKRKFKTERAGFQVVKDPKDRSKLALAINGQPIGEWFKEQFDRLFSSIRRTVEPLRRGKGIGL